MKRMIGVAGIGLIAAGMLATGCGGEAEDGESAESGPTSALVDRLPREEGFAAVAVVDVVAAREALGLPADTDPRTALLGDVEGGSRFSTAVATAIPYLSVPQEIPLTEAVDSTQITAAASNLLSASDASATVIATEQPFEEIAASLEDAGYDRDGDVLTSDEPSFQSGPPVVAGGDGIIAVGEDPATVETVASGEPVAAEGPERDLIAELGGPAAAAVGSQGESVGCLEAFGVVDRLTGGEGEFVVIAGGPATENFVFDDSDDFLAEAYEFGEVTAEDESVRAPFTYPLDDPGGPTSLLLGDIPAGTLYSCE